MTGPTRYEVKAMIERLRSMAVGSEACLDYDFSDFIFSVADTIAALREKLEAAEADRKQGQIDYCALMERHDALTNALTEARARETAAETRGWNAAIEAAAGQCDVDWLSDEGDMIRGIGASIRALGREKEG